MEKNNEAVAVQQDPNDDLILIDVEAHLFPSLKDKSYFPRMQLIKNKRAPNRSYTDWGEQDVDAEMLLGLMDNHGVDYSCILPEIMLSATGNRIPWSTNGWLKEQGDKAPDRMILQCNCGPVMKIGVDKAVWEMDHLVKEMGFEMVKLYPPEDIGPMNDPAMWPFFEKVTELGVPLAIHSAQAYVAGQFTKYCHPRLLEEIATDFPEIPIIAHHIGHPFVDELCWLSSIYKNIYVGTSYILGSTWVSSSPRLAGKLLGKVMQFATPGKLIWGTDFTGNFNEYAEAVNFVRNFQIPEDVQRDYGYAPLTDEDRRKWAGLNLAGLLNKPVEKLAQAKVAA
jgi:predicted TIM-barrel fold metal-dependent hydrolase